MAGCTPRACSFCNSNTWGAPGLAISTSGAGSVCALNVDSAPTLGTSPGIAEGAGAAVTGTAMGTSDACARDCPSRTAWVIGTTCAVGNTGGTGAVYASGTPPGTAKGIGVACGGCTGAACVAAAPSVRGAPASRAPDVLLLVGAAVAKRVLTASPPAVRRAPAPWAPEVLLPASLGARVQRELAAPPLAL